MNVGVVGQAGDGGLVVGVTCIALVAGEVNEQGDGREKDHHGHEEQHPLQSDVVLCPPSC